MTNVYHQVTHTSCLNIYGEHVQSLYMILNPTPWHGLSVSLTLSGENHIEIYILCKLHMFMI